MMDYVRKVRAGFKGLKTDSFSLFGQQSCLVYMFWVNNKKTLVWSFNVYRINISFQSHWKLIELFVLILADGSRWMDS